jgi:gas vesicle protein
VTDTDRGDITERRRDTLSGGRGSFLNGLCTGAVIGTAAGVFFAPQIQAALRNRRRAWTAAAAGAREAVTDTYRDVTTRIAAVVDSLDQQVPPGGRAAD